MKKGEVAVGTVEEVQFPNKAVLHVGGTRAVVKGAISGQKIRFRITKKRTDRIEGQLLEVLEKAPQELSEPACEHFGLCGGCAYQNLPYKEQLMMKGGQVKQLLGMKEIPVIIKDQTENIAPYDPLPGDVPYRSERPVRQLAVYASPGETGYRNKMEFTFGDACKGGSLTLGQHKRGSFYDIIDVPSCRIVDADFRMILTATRDFFAVRDIPYYHRSRHDGILRHLLMRKAMKTGEILVDLVAVSQLQTWAEPDGRSLLQVYADMICRLPLEGTLAGVLYTKNDSFADTIKDEGTKVLYGKNYIHEELLGLSFKITPFSFFQTNSRGAEVLYEQVRRMLGSAGGVDGKSLPVVFDLYSGTGTIAQMIAPAAGKVIGVEIVPEAVEAARENAVHNGLINCEFICGDVLKVLDEIPERPDFIILDPPRDGVHPKALSKIMDYGAESMIYISCKPTSLARDLEVLKKGRYEVEDICCVDLFPGTVHVETVCLLGKRKCAGSEPKPELAQGLDERRDSERSLLDFVNLKPDAYVDLSLDMEDYRRIKAESKE